MVAGTKTNLPELPDIGDDGELLLFDAEKQVRGVVPALIVNHLLQYEGSVIWIDGGQSVSALQLSQVAPGDHFLDAVFVSRSFTTHKHMNTVEDVAGAVVGDEFDMRLCAQPAQMADQNVPSLVVCTGFDGQYRPEVTDLDDRTEAPREAFLRSVATIAGVQRDHHIPILITRTRADGFTEPLERAATRQIGCEMTSVGPRFTGDGVETLVYPVTDGMVQTTILYWKKVCEARVMASSTQKTDEPAATKLWGAV